MRSKKAKLAALAIGVAAAMPLAAQQTTPSGTAGSSVQQQDDGFDWGWLGLLGLIGLAGLRGTDRNRRP